MAKRTVGMLAVMGLVLSFASGAGADQQISWIRQVGGPSADFASGVALNSTRIYVAGSTFGGLPPNTGIGDAFLLEWDHLGGSQVIRQFGTSDFDLATDVVATEDAIFVVGNTDGSLPGFTNAGLSDAFIYKFESNGSLDWVRQFGTTGYDDIKAVTIQGDRLLVFGGTNGIFPQEKNFGGTDIFLADYNVLNGTPGPLTQFGSPGDDIARGITSTPDQIFVAGHTEGTFLDEESAGGMDAFVSAIDPAWFVPTWIHQFGTPQDDFAIQPLAGQEGAGQEGVFIAGDTTGAIVPGQANGAGDIFLSFWNNAGARIWDRQIGTAANEQVSGGDLGPSGIFVAGTTAGALSGQPPLGEQDAFVLRFDTAGELGWVHQFGTPENDFGRDVAVDSGEEVFVGGNSLGAFPSYTNAGGNDVFALRLGTFQPDALLAKSVIGPYLGDDVYNLLGTGQSALKKSLRRRAATFFIEAENDGETTDSLGVEGCAPSQGFGVKYLSGTTGATNITSEVIDGEYAFENVAPGESEFLRVTIQVKRRAAFGSVKQCLISVVSHGDPDLVDVVKARVKVKRPSG